MSESPRLSTVEGAGFVFCRAVWIRFSYPPAFVPVLHDGSGTMYGLWRHVGIARLPCFVGITTEDFQVKEISRTVQQFWTFLALIAATLDVTALDAFLHGTGVSTASVIEVSGDDRALFGAHPVFDGICPSALRNGRPADDAFPTIERPETWSLACCYELHGVDSRAPRWFRESSAVVFAESLAARDWTGAWLSLNAPGWNVKAARTAVDQLASVFELGRTVSGWSKEMSGFGSSF